MTAVCQHYPQCGGCRLQHLSAEEYHAEKITAVRHQLEKDGLDDIEIALTHTSLPRTRRRASLSIRHTSKSIVVGFNGYRTHDMIDLQECHILQPELFALLEKIRTHLGDWLPKGKSCDAQATLIGDIIDLVLVGGPDLGLEQREQLARLAEKLDVARLSWRQWDRSPIEPVAQRQPLLMRFDHATVAFPPGGFLQATLAGEQALTVIAVAATAAHKKVADLYCGIGTFALSLPPDKQIYAAEGNRDAITALTAATRERTNFTAIERDLVGNPLDVNELKKFDAVIIDPPRDGARRQMQLLAKSNISTIVSISCDARSFAHDSKLLRTGGYHCARVELIDQFLWSKHIELAAVFTR